MSDTKVSGLPSRQPVVGVLGSGRDSHEQRATRLGHWLAEAGVHLLTGGGAGVMSAVSRAFWEVQPRAGKVIGILPGAADLNGYRARSGYPNRWVEIAIHTHLPLSQKRGMEPMSRNHINVLSSDVLVALPGGAGTASEVRLALRYGRPCIGYLRADEMERDTWPAGVPAVAEFVQIRRFLERQL